jgi:hypothetical protein
MAGIALGFIMFGCSAIKRHDRLVQRHPYVHQDKIDTIRDTVRITIPEIKVDTFYHMDQLYDTIYLEKERLKVQIYRVRDSIYVSAKCDTIYQEKIISRPVKVVDYIKPTFWDQLKSPLVFMLIVTLLIILITWILRRMRL